jgi:hypothetical protein
MTKPAGSSEQSSLQGEGNREADREYREAATKHAASGKTEAEGRQAEAALEGAEADELKRAEQAGKEKAKGPASR